jgi:hypothetical protein
MSNCYQSVNIIVPTKHNKCIALAQPFFDTLGANIIEYPLDTDAMGTFSGEVDRNGTSLECARNKCLRALEKIVDTEYCIASEGSFGPHPFIPFLPCDHEILYFIDVKNDFHLYMTHLSTKTNYQMKSISSFQELESFAELAKFPTHALILRPEDRSTKSPIYKGIDNKDLLQESFSQSLKHSSNKRVWVETDMRAHLNPSRMLVIKELATMFAQRLLTLCPLCNTPGWGKVRIESGLECSVCSLRTELIKHEIFGCTKCDYEEIMWRSDGIKKAGPENCEYCNP